MACGCITPTEHADLDPFVALLAPVVYTGLNNVVEVGGQLYRSGGTPDTNDAYAYSDQFVEGTGCGYWEMRQFFDNDDTNNTIFVVLEDEFGTANRYGWFFQNGIASFRRSPFHGTISDFPIYYGPSGGPAPPDQVGYNVGYRFGIYYNNGTVTLYENVQFTNDTNDFTEPNSYEYPGLPTDRRWHLKVYVFPAAATAHSPSVTEYITTLSDVCGTALWTLPPLGWTATGTVSPASTVGTVTVRFDAGSGSEYYMVAPVIDSGDDLRSKVMKSMRVTGRRTNVSMKAYGYDVQDTIRVQDLEDGTNASTRAQEVADTTRVAESPRKQINVPNAVLSTIRIEGNDTGNTERDEIHEAVIEQAQQGARR